MGTAIFPYISLAVLPLVILKLFDPMSKQRMIVGPASWNVDNDDDDSDRSSSTHGDRFWSTKMAPSPAVVATASTHTLISHSKAASTSATTKVIIDLCGEESPNTIIIDAGNNPHRPMKRSRCLETEKKPCSQQDVIDVDQENHNIDSETMIDDEGTDVEDAAYRRILGPMRMEFIDHWYTPHAFDNTKIMASATRMQTTTVTTTSTTRRLYKELVEYQINLPISKISSVFVRAHGSQLDLLRVCITGPHGTPYSMGCFFFDMALHQYPHQPPRVSFLTTNQKSIRFNPNLYECGKVCLSLLGTWHGPGWVPHQSTLLQVLVSIQGLIFVEEPYFNEPGYERDRGLPKGQRASEQYNANIRKYTLQYAIAEPLQRLVNYYNDTTTTTKTNNKQWQYPEFTNVIKQHFLQSAKRIEQQLQDWTTATATTGNKNDPALIAIAHEIRQNLAILQSQDENEKQLLRQQQQQLDLETKPKSRPPKPAETIELLDDDE